MKLEFLKKIKVFLQKHIKKVFFLLGIIIFLFLVSFIVRFKNRNVVAVIDGYKITLEEIVAELEVSPESYKYSVLDNSELAIDNYINQIILYQKAKKYAKKYKKSIRPKMRNYYIKTLSQEYVENELVKQIKIEEAEITKYYNLNLNDFIIPERVRIYEIVLPTQLKAEETLRRLSHGESFEMIAMRESISESKTKGGDIGWIDTRKLDTEISSMIKRINPGDILANIVKTDLGYHIIKLASRTERRMLTISEATPSIINILKIQEKKREIDSIVKSKREKSKIKIFKDKTPLIKESFK